MLINPQTAIAEKWISHPACTNEISSWQAHKFLSSNAIDFTLDKICTISDDTGYISEQHKELKLFFKETPPYKHRNTNEMVWRLDKNTVVDGMSSMYITVPSGVVCKLITRSTFNRTGCFLLSGLYDSGYEGHIGFVIHNTHKPLIIGVGTRIGQIEFWTSDSEELYEGGYNHTKGTHWAEK